MKQKDWRNKVRKNNLLVSNLSLVINDFNGLNRFFGTCKRYQKLKVRSGLK